MSANKVRNLFPKSVLALIYRIGVPAILLASVCIHGCASHRSENSVVTIKNEIGVRSNVDASVSREPCEEILPFEVGYSQPISVDDAIQTALTNNDAFHATLAQIGMAEGDLLQAKLLTNPNFATMIPIGTKQWEWTLFVPIEAFLLRPQRIDLAEKDRGRIANQLVQTGLTLVRDVQVAYTDLALATEQHQLALETLAIRTDVKELTEKRLEDGDIAELEAIQARVDALNAKANERLLEQNVAIARQRLALLMGIPHFADQIVVAGFPDCRTEYPSVDELIEQASIRRPDLRSSEWSVEAAETRCRLARKAWWRFEGVADYNGSGDLGAESGPGLLLDIPIFNRNQGGVMRACAELDAAKYNRDQVRDQIVQQVRLASTQAQQASDNLHMLQTEILPALSEALEIAKLGFEEGGTSYLLVLQTTSQYVDAKSRMLDQSAAICRAHAELQLSCGGF